MEELLEGRANVLTKTGCLPHLRTPSNKNTSYYYNQFSAQLVGNYANWVFAQPVMDWCFAKFKTVTQRYVILIEGSLEEVAWAGLPITWEKVYPMFFLVLKETGEAVMETTPWSSGESPSSSRDKANLEFSNKTIAMGNYRKD